MSKSMVNTKQKILDKALEMWNERGIEYVGLRELASVLDMRVSNITYYYPTKDDLVFALASELNKANSGLLTIRETLSLDSFLHILQQVYKNHIKFRCLLLSVVHLLKQNKHMALSYEKTQVQRKATLTSNLRVLNDAGYLHIQDDTDLSFLVSSISLISRFSISETAISFRKSPAEDQVHHYIFIITKLLAPFTTAK